MIQKLHTNLNDNDVISISSDEIIKATEDELLELLGQNILVVNFGIENDEQWSFDFVSFNEFIKKKNPEFYNRYRILIESKK